MTTNKLERLGLIGDIHAEDVLLERVIDHLQQLGVQQIAAVGDIADGPGDLNRCCELIASHHVLAVRGNHDRWLLANSMRDLPEATPLSHVDPASLELLARLPATLELETVSGRALLCHGLGANDMAKVSADDYGYALSSNEDLQHLLTSHAYRWVLHGHSHRTVVRHFDRVSFINAGTLKPDHDPGFLEVDFRSGIVNRFVIDSPRENPRMRDGGRLM